MPRPKLLILDADVLIDYANSELRVLGLAARHLGPVHIARPLLAEVEQLSEPDCEALGLDLVEPTLEQLIEAGSQRGPLSFPDRLCLILARDQGYVCVSNDRRLRKECSAKGIGVLWGLELMVELVRRNRLQANKALRISRAIHESNPRHISTGVIARFEQRILRLNP